MNLDAIIHRLKWSTRAGKVYRTSITWLGVSLLRAGRKLIKKGSGRCTWCGAACGFDSTVSSKGLRCSSLSRDCTKMPDIN